MSFIKNHKESTSVDRKLYTGVAEIDIVAINPTKEELSELLNGAEVKEPTYTETSKDGNRKVRIDFWYRFAKDPDTVSKFAIWLEDKDRFGQNSGKTQYINNRCQTAWGKSIEDIANDPNLQWFDTSTARVAKDGEESLYDVLVKLTNASLDAESDLELDSLDDIFNGDVSELVGINEKLGKGLKVLVGVKDGKYQDTYTKMLLRRQTVNLSYIQKSLEKERGEFNADYNNSFDFALYTAPSMPDNQTTVLATTAEDDGTLF